MSSALTGSCFGRPGEVHDPRPLGGDLQGGLLGLFRGSGHAHPLGSGAAGAAQCLGHAIVVTGHPRVVHEGPHHLEGELQALRG